MADIVPPLTITGEDIPLFPGFEPSEPHEREDLSPDRRRTQRQAGLIAAGIHPLTKQPLHPLASRHRDATAPKKDPFTCGSCRFREVLKYHDTSFPKCLKPGAMGADEYEQHGPRFATHSASTDVRAWWPACPDYSPGDSGLSPDAARSIPSEVDA